MMIAITVVYIYLCLVYLLTGMYIGLKEFPPRIEDYNSPFLFLVTIMHVPLAPLVLWLQNSYGFKASVEHIGGAGLVLICGSLFGSWIHAYASKKAGTYSPVSSRFNRSRLKISVAMIAGVWGAVIGNSYPLISIKFFLKDGYVSTVTVLAVIAGWLISRIALNLLDRTAKIMDAHRSKTIYANIVNFVTAIGLFHLGFLLFQDRGGFVFQKIAVGLIGAPTIALAVLSGIDPE